MKHSISSIEDFDKLLFDEYAKFVGYFPDKPESFIQRRFAQVGIFPDLGWALIEAGETQALSSKNPAFLYAMMSRFTKCAHGWMGHADERGLHGGGYDFCSLVVTSLYSAILGKSYISSIFHCNRKMSVTGYGAYKHAANLMICLECNDWQYKEKSITKAHSFVSAKSNSKIDKAFVGFFLGLLVNDREQVRQSLIYFSEGYLKSDWGKYKPFTKSTFIHALITYSKWYMVNPIDVEAHRALISNDRFELWQEFQILHSQFENQPHQFTAQLSFLNDLTIS